MQAKFTKEELYHDLVRYGMIVSDTRQANNGVNVRITTWAFMGSHYVSIQLNGEVIHCEEVKDDFSKD